jgi:NAD(P)-dependent dehydrogenase (short-subunit alcohol dehydrogenase family)
LSVATASLNVLIAWGGANSRAKVMPRSAQRAYQLSKYGLVTYSRRAVRTWAERGARIVSVSPGLIATLMGTVEFEQVARLWLRCSGV